MAKPAPQWALRFKSPSELPNVAKFSDPPQWGEAELPVSMYFEVEDLKEDDMPVIEKDSEYYRRKRERRSSYRKKNTLVLEDSSADRNANTGFRFEGKLCNLGLADIEDAKSKASTVEEAPFRYVLLQFVKKESGSDEKGSTSEVNVIPVGDMFAFKKASKVADELLADIDERFLEEQQKSKGNISRYKGISKSLTSAERARLGLKPEEEEAPGRGQGLNAKEFLTGFGSSALFGAAVNKALRGGGRRGRGADAEGEGAAGGSRNFLNENGMDVDELRAEENQSAGDYSTRFVDDEEEYVTVEQTRNQVMADNELNASQRYSAEAEDGEESAGESTEDEEEQEQQARAKELRDDEPGMVDDSMISGAAQARRLFVSKSGVGSRGASGSALALSGSSVALDAESAKGAASVPQGRVPISAQQQPVKSALKRGRDEAFPAEVGPPAGGEKPSKVSFVEGGSVDTGGSVNAEVNATPMHAAEQQVNRAAQPGSAGDSAAAAATAAGVAVEYPLTEQGFRLFMRNRGGKVPPADMNFFKPQLKAADKAVKKRFYDIVLAITVEVEDARLGKVLALKQP